MSATNLKKKFSYNGHRGDSTENLINITNEILERKNLALISKVPTPIKVLKIQGAMIAKAFFEERSIVDYQGVVQGHPIAFDAKETNQVSLPLKNIHEHQIRYMEKFSSQKGLSFVICNYKKQNVFILIPIEIISDFYVKALNGGRKSIPLDSINKDFIIEQNNQGFLGYLPIINVYLDYKKEGKLPDTKAFV